MRGVIVESGAPTALPDGYGAWLTTALREQERRAVALRPRALRRGVAGMRAEPRIDGAACAAWLAAVPARDGRQVRR